MPPKKAAATRVRQRLRKDGVLVLNKARAAPVEKTVVILGTAGGGARMVVKVLQALGVPMGDASGKSAKDPDLARAVKWRDIGLVRQLIERRNAAHAVWGWQCLDGAEHADIWTNQLRNPYVVAIFSDPFVASTRRRLRMPSEIFPAMERLMCELQMKIVFLRRYGGPTLVCSRERAVAEPETWVRALDGFLGLGAEERWPEAISLVRRSPAPGTGRQ